MVAPAGEVQALIAPLGGAGGQLLKREVGPGPGEQQDGTGHHALPVQSGERGAKAPRCRGLTSWSAAERPGPSPHSQEARGAARWAAAPVVPIPGAAKSPAAPPAEWALGPALARAASGPGLARMWS